MNKQKYLLILESAEKLFNRFGISKTAVDEIAELARVAKGTIYNNFTNKEGLLSELLQKKTEDFESKIENIFASLTDPVARMKCLLSERIKILIETPFLSDKMLKMDEKFHLFFSQELDQKLRSLIGTILEMDHKPIFSTGDKQRITDTILYTLKGIENMIKNKTGQISPKKIEQDLDFLIKLIFQI